MPKIFSTCSSCSKMFCSSITISTNLFSKSLADRLPIKNILNFYDICGWRGKESPSTLDPVFSLP